MIPDIEQQKPSEELYNLAKAYFIASGGNLAKYCRSIKTDPMYAKMCLMGVTNGPKAIKLRNKIVSDAAKQLKEKSGKIA